MDDPSGPRPGRRTTHRAGLVGLAVAGVLLGGGAAVVAGAGGGDTGLAARPAVAAAPPSPAAVPAPVVGLPHPPGTAGLHPSRPWRFTATGGLVTNVVVTGPTGPVPGALAADGTWTPSSRLALGTRYAVQVAAAGRGGTVSTTAAYTTLVPTALAGTRVQPLAGETVGVGMPVVVSFTAPVRDRAATLAALRVVSTPAQEGAWRWTADDEVHWRPRAYWRPGTRVVLEERLAGLDLGGGVFGKRDRDVAFTVGEDHRTVIDAQRHTMTVRSGGRVVRVVPVSTGRASYPTTSGTHLVLERHASKVMDSSTVGIPRDSAEGYRLTALWSTRISYSGEFIHAAPWSVGAQGRSNVSHGCVNASTADARWFYDFSRRGDVVDVVGTPRRLEPGNGLTDWLLSWQEWTAPQ